MIHVTTGELHERGIASLMIAGFVALAIGFSLGPIFEGPDEIGHYRYARLIARTHALPDVLNLPALQYHQAPLYYLLTAPLTTWPGSDDSPNSEGGQNQYTYTLALGGLNLTGNDNKNFYVHSRAENFPYNKSPMARAVHVSRLLSVLLGVATVITSYAIFRILWPERPDRQLTALGIVAFWPQFAYLSGTLNNDNLLIFLATISLWLLLRQLRDGPSWVSMTLLGLVLGSALLTKISAVFLVLPIGAAMLLDLRRIWRYAILCLMVAFAICGWWYIRNAILYNDPFLTHVYSQLYPWEAIGTQGWRGDIAFARAPEAYARVWARFGWLTVPVATPIYRFFDFLTILAFGGGVLRSVRALHTGGWKQVERATVQQIVVVGGFVVAWVAMLLYYSGMAYFGNQGRYLLVGIAGWGALFAFGMDTWTPARLRMQVALSSAALMSTVAAICLFGYFLPAYRPLPLPAQIEHPLALRFENAAELIGVRSEVVHARPGQSIRITLYWRAIQPTATSLTAYLHSVGNNVVFRDSLPATGNLLSTDWLPGQTWAEEYVVIIPQDTEQQVAYPLVAGLYETQTQRGLTASNTAGNEVTPFVGRIAINGPAQPFDPDYRFGDVIGLAEPQITRRGERLDVCLRWLSLVPTSTDYHVFVHVVTDDGQLVAQSDSSPKGGRYPTDMWVSGEAIDDCLSLDIGNIPATGWHVALGLYQLPGGERLPVQNRQGQTLPDGTVSLPPSG